VVAVGRHPRRRIDSTRCLIAALAVGALTAACTSASPGSTGGTTPSSSISSISSSSATPGPSTVAASHRPVDSPAGSPHQFDPASISITLRAFASVPGGPLAITAPHDGSGRLFVAAQDGRAWVVRPDGTTAARPLLDLSAKVTTGGERGLLGIAIHPGFPTDPRVFVDYTDLDGNTVVASYRISADDPNRLDERTAVAILGVTQPFANHNGGALAFGPDGFLYVSLGDGGGGGDPNGNGQSLATLLGKILRIDVDLPGRDGSNYAIPTTNPFVAANGARGEIWLYGLRNPWRLSFDRATGDLWIGDVGQNAWEEVDVAPARAGGLDFGWNRMEGAHCYQPAQGCDTSNLVMPVAEYGHDQGCTVIGGVVYRGSDYPMLRGAYLYADYCSGRLWALDAATAMARGSAPGMQVGMVGPGMAGFGEDEAGEVYVASLGGSISRVIATRR
jgi:glucose/arabinose dehydrogenase